MSAVFPQAFCFAGVLYFCMLWLMDWSVLFESCLLYLVFLMLFAPLSSLTNLWGRTSENNYIYTTFKLHTSGLSLQIKWLLKESGFIWFGSIKIEGAEFKCTSHSSDFHKKSFKNYLSFFLFMTLCFTLSWSVT